MSVIIVNLNYGIYCMQTGSTALIVASKAGQYDTIQQLLDLGGNPDIQDRVRMYNNLCLSVFSYFR